MTVEEEMKERVVMARDVARRWLQKAGQIEYRFSIYGLGPLGGAKRFASVLRSWRDGKIRVSGVGGSIPSIPDLGVREFEDGVEVWSSDHTAMARLAKWADARDLETTFIW